MRRAFTLLELVTTVAIIAILAVLLLPALQNAYGKAKRIACGSNLRNVGVAFHSWAHDHGDLFPMQVSTSAGGTREFAEATALNPDVSLTFRHFQAISNELVSPVVLACPADNRRSRAASFASLGNENVSYWINPAAAFGRVDSPLAGDRNVRTSGRIEWTFIRFGPSDTVEFSAELHGHRGNVLFGDAHVDVFDSGTLAVAFASSNGTELTLSIPRPDTATATDNGGSSVGNSGSALNGETPSLSASQNSSRANAPAGTANMSSPPGTATGPTDSARRTGGNHSRGVGAEQVVIVTRLDGAVVTSSVPLKVATSSATSAGERFPAGNEPANPLIEFMQWLTRASARGTYWLLFLLLLLRLVAFEVARRRGRGKRERRTE